MNIKNVGVHIQRCTINLFLKDSHIPESLRLDGRFDIMHFSVLFELFLSGRASQSRCGLRVRCLPGTKTETGEGVWGHGNL